MQRRYVLFLGKGHDRHTVENLLHNGHCVKAANPRAYGQTG